MYALNQLSKTVEASDLHGPFDCVLVRSPLETIHDPNNHCFDRIESFLVFLVVLQEVLEVVHDIDSGGPIVVNHNLLRFASRCFVDD